jgi:integrase
MDWTEKDVRTWKRSDAGGVYYVTIPGQTGWKSSGKTKKAHAVEWALVQANGGHRPDVTLGEYAGGFFEAPACPIIRISEARGAKNTQKHWDDQRAALVRYILPKWGKTMLAGLEPAAVFTWLSSPKLIRAEQTGKYAREWKKIPLSGAHRNRILGVINAIMDQAVFDGVISSNPLKAVPRMALNSAPRGTFTAAELSLLFPEDDEALEAVWRGRSWAVLFLVLADTGLRPSEALALKWRDWHPSAMAFVVSERIGSDGQPGPLKTAKAGVVKKVALVRGRCAELLDDLWQERAGEPDDLLFPAERYAKTKGQPMRVAVAGNHFVDSMDRAKVTANGRTLYCLRHTAATASTTEFGAEVTRGRMGWTKSSKMVEHYDHPQDAEMVARALKDVGRA